MVLVATIGHAGRQSTMLGLRRFWSQSIRLTCRTCDLPAPVALDEAMAAPAGQIARAVDAELADQEVRAHHAGGASAGGEHLDIGDHPHGARLRRLRPGIAGAQAVDAVFHAPAVVERDRDLAPRIAGLGRARHPVDAFRRVHREPFVEAELVEQPRLPLEQQAETVALGRIVDDQIVALPVGEALDQLAVERVGDVVRAERRIVGELHARLTARAARRGWASPSSAASTP